jgi:hypothetical protein
VNSPISISRPKRALPPLRPPSQLNNTYPALNYTAITDKTAAADLPSPLLLSNLDQLNTIGGGTSFDNCNVYLTSKDNVTAKPQWLYEVLPIQWPLRLGARSCAIIVNDYGGGVVDAFYMYFYAFNLGETASNQVLGDYAR